LIIKQAVYMGQRNHKTIWIKRLKSEEYNGQTGWPNEGGWDEWNLHHTWADKNCMQNFALKTWREILGYYKFIHSFVYLHATNPLQGHKTHQDIDIVKCHNIKYKYKRSKAKHYNI
jgi:hypothetical protein